MSDDTFGNMNPNLKPKSKSKRELLFVASAEAPLRPVQHEFNRLMKQLESAQRKQASERVRLDQVLDRCIRELMPLLEKLHRADRDLIFAGMAALNTAKLTKNRRKWFADLISGKASDLLSDSAGLNADDVERLQAVVDDLGPCLMEQNEKMNVKEDLDYIRTMLEQMAKNAGIDLDISDIDMESDPDEIQRQFRERMRSAFKEAGENSPKSSQRKSTKSQLEKQARLKQQEEAKKRDFKTLYKQLAKALHPDLEIDPLLKSHKETWMKRLTSAYSNGDLHDMLRIEMEWLGEEAGNLAKAGDDKLKVYCTVLKEQIASLKDQTAMLIHEPQYGPLSRFIDPAYGYMTAPSRIKLELEDEIALHQDMLKTMRTNDSRRREMINDLADDHARASCGLRNSF